ncbi:hypothetical protein V5O48_005297, partial [Marasmius crinis-equi]
MNDRENLILRQIEEDWDSYEGTLVDDSPLESPVEDIKKGFADLISCSNEELVQIFRSWKTALDSQSDMAPPLLAVLLKGVYPKIPAYSQYNTANLEQEQNIKVSSLQDNDRQTLANLAPLARSYGFDMHLGQSQYLEYGLVNVGGANLWEDDEYEVGDPEKAEFERELDEDMEYREELDINHVFSLDGIPMTLEAEVLEAEDIKELQSIFVNGSVTDGLRESEVEEFSQLDGGPYLTRTWTRRILLLSPKGSKQTQIAPRADSYQWSRYELELSPPSSASSTRERKLVDELLKWLDEETSKNPDSRRPLQPEDCRDYAACVLNRAVAWKDVNLLNRLVRSCARETIAVIGDENLVAAHQAFGGNVMKETISQAMQTDSSLGRQMQLARNLRDVAQVARDDDLVAWCSRELESLFGKLSKLEVGAIPYVLERAESQQNSLLALQEVLESLFGQVQYSDADMWRVLFERLAQLAQRASDSSSFDESGLAKLIYKCLQRIATELPPFTEAKSPSYYYPTRAVKHIVSFVELCLQFDAGDLPEVFFRRMKNGAAENDKNSRDSPAYRYYSELVTEFDNLIKAKPEAQKLLDMFFNDALLAMLSCCSDTYLYFSLPLDLACLNLDDPSKAIQEWLTPDRVNSENTKNEGPILSTARKLIESLRAHARPQSQRVLEQCSNVLKPLAMIKVDKFNPSGLSRCPDRQSALDIINLLLAFDDSHSEPLISQLLNKILRFGDTPAYITYSLVPFMAQLKKFLQNHDLRRRRSLVDQPYADFAAGTTIKWIQHVLQLRPCPEIAVEDLKVGCECAICTKHLAPLFTTKQTEQKKFKMNLPESQKGHLEQQLGGLQRLGITWRVVSVSA